MEFPHIFPDTKIIKLEQNYRSSKNILALTNEIIKKAKELMVEKGHTYYQSRKLDRVPKEAVEELLGITLPDKQE